MKLSRLLFAAEEVDSGSVSQAGELSWEEALAEKWHDMIDIDAGNIATGRATIEDVGWEIVRLMLNVASGRKQTWSDRWGLHNALAPFNPGPVT